MHESGSELPAPARAGRVVCRWPGNLCFWCGARSCSSSGEVTELAETGAAPPCLPQHLPGRGSQERWGSPSAFMGGPG